MTVVKAIGKTWIWLTLFSIAMGFMESAVVVYIREISYPEGFDFPLVPMDNTLEVTEILREAATMIMLLAAGYLGGRTLSERFTWFLYCFAIWDIFYYVFLKLLLGWPASFMTWDILFLIPVAWTGPVITPVIISLTMILLAATILYFSYREEQQVRIALAEWILLTTGSVVVILSFTWDFCSYFLPLVRESDITGIHLIHPLTYGYIPDQFNWFLYIAGEIVILTGIINIWLRYRRPGTDRSSKGAVRL